MSFNRSRLIPFTAIAVIALVSVFVYAQRQRASPHETVEMTLNGKKISITYGRPYMKGRKIFGELVPFGRVWRTGADEKTKLVTEADLMIGSLSVPKGSYSLWTVPAEDGWKLVVNKAADGWGTQYDESQDFGRTDMKVKKLSAPVEQFTIKLTPAGKGGLLTMQWEQTEAAIDITAK